MATLGMDSEFSLLEQGEVLRLPLLFFHPGCVPSHSLLTLLFSPHFPFSLPLTTFYVLQSIAECELI